jgi:hypothetical protein
LPQPLTVAAGSHYRPVGPDNGSPEEDGIVHHGGVTV